MKDYSKSELALTQEQTERLSDVWEEITEAGNDYWSCLKLFETRLPGLELQTNNHKESGMEHTIATFTHDGEPIGVVEIYSDNECMLVAGEWYGKFELFAERATQAHDKATAAMMGIFGLDEDMLNL